VSEHFLEFTYNAKLLVERRATPCGQQQRFRMKTIGLTAPAMRLAALVLFLLFALAVSLGQTPPKVSFVGRMDYAVGNAQGIVVGDLNSDGNLDLVTVNSGSVPVLLGNADGTFQPAVNYTVPSNSIIVQLGDFNGDGKLDILVASRSTSVPIVSVSVLLGNGDGTFQAQKVTNVANSSCQCLAIGDFNGDSKLDVALPVSLPQLGESALAVMLGNGDGTFQPPVTANPGPFPTPNCFQAADFNNDGILDIVSGTETNSSVGTPISVFLGKGDGTFQPPVNTTALLGPGGLAVADFTGDGKLDLAFSTSPYGNSVSVLPGNADGTFQPAISTAFQYEDSCCLFSADLNGDGKQDLVLGGSSITVLLGNGDGTFQLPGLSAYDLSGGGPLGAAFGDFNKDGKLDITTLAYNSVASVAFGKGDGTFQLDSVVDVGWSGLGGSGGSAVAVLADDFTGHGNTDLFEILGYTELEPFFVVLPANGNGAFQSPAAGVQLQSCYYNDPQTACSAAVGDFNGDGKFDVAITGNISSGPQTIQVGVLLGNGDGTFKSEVDYGGGGSSIDLGDINNDGITDIVTSGGSADNVSFLLGKGDGTFGFPTTVPINGTANFVATADFNNDGNLDLAVGTGSAVAILLGNGNGTFGPEMDYPIPAGVTTLAVGDFNGNGRIDLVAGSSSSNSVSVLLNTGGGAFSVATYPVLGNVTYVGVGDFNGDGIPDLAVLNNQVDISILVGNGDGTFQPAVSFGTGDAADTQFAIADLNGDGSPDIAVGNSLLFNRPAGPAASLAPSQAAFGNIAVGSPSGPQTVTLTNTSPSAVTISGVTITGPQSSEFAETNTCTIGIAVGANCTIAITFTPAAAGSRSATLSVADNTAHSPQAVALSGTGMSLGLGSSNLSATIAAGQTASYTLSIGGGAFSGTATLTCAGVPTAANCSLPASENVSATMPSTFTVSVTTTAPTTAARIPSSFPHSGWLWTMALVGIVILPGSSNRRRTSRLLPGLPIILLLFICSCGGTGSNRCEACSSGTPAGKYTLTVAAASGSMRQSQPLTLIVQ